MNAANAAISSVTGRCTHLSATTYSSSVCAPIIASSHSATTAVHSAASEKARLARPSRSRHPAGRCTRASVTQAPATMDQTTATKLIAPRAA